VSVADIAASIGPALRKQRSPARSTPSGRHLDGGRSRRRGQHRHGQGSGWAVDHPSLDRAPPGERVQELFPGAQVTSARDRGRFLLRFCVQDAIFERRPRGDREAHGEIAARDVTVHRRLLPRDEAVEHFKRIGEHYKAEIIGASPPESRSACMARAIGKTSAADRMCRARQAQGVQAHEGGGRLLARRLPQRDAATNLRHAWANEKQLKEYLTVWKRLRSAITGASARSSTCFTSRRRPRCGVLASESWALFSS